MSELLHCPFCGPGKVYLNAPNKDDRYGSINCPACMVVMPGAVSDQDELIRCWNTRADWQPIDGAPTDRFIFLYCHEDNSRWLAKWQGSVWYGVDVEHGLTREGHTWGDPEYVTGWFVSQWADVPAGPQS